jgi:hypothetical protein
MGLLAAPHGCLQVCWPHVPFALVAQGCQPLPRPIQSQITCRNSHAMLARCAVWCWWRR